ncbi:cation diffusion facilitator family transporter [uncultured Microbacterium sp.]|uniref:cation diffusion facilitator family transporter n=1 Tax=uncultured Microbacterium sp. TaxID=191216 RepID=UPI0025FF54B9|nr:cation diffusion facilitator family transporter [uncultured Microbacterium sp.]
MTPSPGTSPEATPATAAPAPSGGESWVTVVIAFIANLAVAIAKTVAAVLTGSAAMVAEAAHSWADAGNEIFLLVAERRSSRTADPSHPTGYGREAYVWSMFAAFGLFAVGAAVSIWHGIQSLFEPEVEGDYLVAYIVLALSAVFEGFSFVQSIRQARGRARALKRGTLDYVSHGSNSTLRAVFFEDAAALIGLAIAAAALALHQITGIAAFDAAGSILVGVLLAVVAIVLIDRNRRYLVGESVTPAMRDQVLGSLIAHRAIDRVTYLHIEFVGAGRVYVVAAVDLTGDDREGVLAVRLRELERDIEQNPLVEEVVLTPAAPGEPALHPGVPGTRRML